MAAGAGGADGSSLVGEAAFFLPDPSCHQLLESHFPRWRTTLSSHLWATWQVQAVFFDDCDLDRDVRRQSKTLICVHKIVCC